MVALSLVLVPLRMLSLDEAVQAASEKHSQVRQARALTEVARDRAAEARSALLPQVVGSASYTRTTANFVFRPGVLPSSVTPAETKPTFDTFNFWSLGGTATQLVYDFGQ